jgi:CO dehydrogenase nickel-insertion accessory protein CooC1
LLGELEGDDQVVICDMEAGLGTVSRIGPGQLDAVLVVAEPSAKGIEVARRAASIGASRAPVIVVANRLRDEADLAAVRAATDGHELSAVPEEPVILRADREGLAPIDLDPGAPGVKALLGLADRLADMLDSHEAGRRG